MSNYHVPRLNLAPKTEHFLRWWHPCDYLLLLYWVFFLPQAFSRYLDSEQLESHDIGTTHSKFSILVAQGIILSLFFTLVFVAIIVFTTENADWLEVLSSMVLGVTSGMASSLGWGVGLAMAPNMAWRVVLGLVLGIIWRLIFAIALLDITDKNITDNNLKDYLEPAIIIGVAVGLAWSMAWRNASRLALGASPARVSEIKTSGLASGFAWAVAVGWLLGLKWFLIWVGVLLWLTVRPDDWLLGFLFIKPNQVNWKFLHVTRLPMFSLTTHLTHWLRGDWETGLHNLDQILTYTFQSEAVMGALRTLLDQTPKSQLISRMAQVAENISPQNLSEWNLLRLGNEQLGKVKTSKRLAAVADGFWFLSEKKPHKAVRAFTHVRYLPYGEEMLTISQILTNFHAAKDLASLATLTKHPFVPSSTLRIQVWQTLDNFYQVIEDVRTMEASCSSSMRFFIHRRALDTIKDILKHAHSLPHPERNLVISIAKNWQDALLKVENLQMEVGEISLATGFWHLQQQKITKAVEAFAVARDNTQGKEMLAITQILADFRKARDIYSIAALPICNLWEPSPSSFRPQTWSALANLGKVVGNVAVIAHSVSPSMRSFAHNRALGELETILREIHTVPDPERQLIIQIARNWQDVLLQIASEVGKITITKPVRNPYIVGDPVEGKLFVGREDIIHNLEELWRHQELLQSVVLYGHRRMGKTSILRNVTRLIPDIKFIYVNLQCLGSISHGLGEVLMAITDEISAALRIEAPEDEQLLQLPERTFERYLKKVLEVMEGKPLIIALDEFETIEELIEAGQISKTFMGFLRGLMQMSPRFAFAFAGLHTLDEMNGDYFEPFFASVISIPVSFLETAATCQILANPVDRHQADFSPDAVPEEFPLDYTLPALDHIHELTAGQPYLVQKVGFQLVRCYNEQVFEHGRKREAIFTIEDVDEVIQEADFFKKGRYYFEGVWSQAGQGAQGQREIIRALANHKQGVNQQVLAETLAMGEQKFTEAVSTLINHDVIASEEGKLKIIVELFRRWVCQNYP